MIDLVAMNDLTISNISTTTRTTMNIECITPSIFTIATLQSISITNAPMKLYSTIIIDLIEIDFAKLLINMSPAIARLDNLNNHNLSNSFTITIEFIII